MGESQQILEVARERFGWDKLRPGQQHGGSRQWGEGVVQRYDGDQVVILFDTAGYRTLSVELVTERGLLDPADA